MTNILNNNYSSAHPVPNDRKSQNKIDPTYKAELKALYDDLILGWNTRDAKLFVKPFSELADFISFDGSKSNGIQAIGRHVSRIFKADQPGTIIAIVKEIRQISVAVFVLNAVAGIIPAGERYINPALNNVQTVISNRENGKHLVDLFQLTPITPHLSDLKNEITLELQGSLASRYTSRT